MRAITVIPSAENINLHFFDIQCVFITPLIEPRGKAENGVRALDGLRTLRFELPRVATQRSPDYSIHSIKSRANTDILRAFRNCHRELVCMAATESLQPRIRTQNHGSRWQVPIRELHIYSCHLSTHNTLTTLLVNDIDLNGHRPVRTRGKGLRATIRVCECK